MIPKFTLDNFTKIASPKLKPEIIQLYFQYLFDAMEKYQINTMLRVCHFLAQLSHESGAFSIIEENLNYSATRLMQVFPKYFPTQDLALKYERQPKAIANKVYANRMGNSTEASGDGYKYRGKGFVQLTGRTNMQQIGKALGIDLETNPDLILEPKYLALSAGEFWNSRDLNKFADEDNIKEITRRINGGFNGLEDRIVQYNKIKKILS